VLLPEELPLRPALGILAAPGERVLHERAAGAELELEVAALVAELGREVLEAAPEIRRHREAEAVEVVVPLGLDDGLVLLAELEYLGIPDESVL
jgi:hypothetical protein